MLKNSINMTSQSIFIDNFTQKQNFCYSILYFKNIEGITNQGQILDYSTSSEKYNNKKYNK